MQNNLSLYLLKILPLVTILTQIISVHPYPSSLFKIYFNIIFPSTPRSSKLSLSFRFPYHNCVCICNSLHTYCMCHFLVIPGFITQNLLDEDYKLRSSLFSSFLQSPMPLFSSFLQSPMPFFLLQSFCQTLTFVP